MRKSERKRQLLVHAKQLFVSVGYACTTMEAIAAAAGVSEAVLYRHFAAKKDLFVEVMKELREATLQRWHAETTPLGDALAKLHAIADLYLAAAREHALEFRILHRILVETDDEEIAWLLRSYYLDCETLLAQVISEGQHAGVFRRPLDPRVGAWAFIRAALGYTLTLPLNVPLYQQADYLPQAIECLLHCLLKTDV